VVALAFDTLVLAAFTMMKLQSDPAIVAYASAGIVAVFIYERFYLAHWLMPQRVDDQSGV
jgi:hypothetical protein